jgi:integrase
MSRSEKELLTLCPQFKENSSLTDWGFSMKSIRALGNCPKCRKPFKKDNKKGFFCPDCLTHPERYLIDIFYKGERIRRATTLDGKTLRSFADAHGLLRHAQNKIDAHKFDASKWKAKDRIDYRFFYQIDRWYKEKEDEMKKGKLSPAYVPKLFTYITHYYLPFFGNTDVREIFNPKIKDFAKHLPDRLCLKYQKNIIDALRHFFRWLNEDRLIDDVPVFKTIEVPEHEPKIISPDTQAMILNIIPDAHKPIFTFLFNQGCRPSEVRALKWKDIQSDTVVIRRTWSASTLREQTKTKRIRHNLLFSETLKALPPRRFGEEFVFTHGKSLKRHYSHNYLNKIFRQATSQLGLEIELYEATKHSFGTHYVNSGISKDLLKEWFGHASIKSTEIYAKIKVVDAFRQMQNDMVADIKTVTKPSPSA